MICYESRKLKEHDQNYPTHDIELASIIHTLRMWRHYLMGRKFLLKKNNTSLNYLFNKPDLNARKGRWFDFVCEYHLKQNNIKWKENKISDALSRRIHMIYEVALSQIDAYFHDNIRAANRIDAYYVEILKKFQEDRLFQKQKEYHVDESWLLWYKDRLYFPERGDIQSNILR